MLSKTLLKKATFAVVGIAGAAMLTASIAQAADVDLSGKRVEWLIPFKEGGGSDRWARFYTPRLSKALPGEPVVVVKNVPGGGSTKGANQFAARGKANGTMIFGTSGSTQFPYLLGDKRVRYEYKDWTVVLATATGGVFYVNPDLGVKSAADILKLKGQELRYGSQGATSLDLVPLLALDMLGLDVKAVFGMKGRGAGRLAFERGEVNVDYQTSSAFLKKSKPLVDSGKAVPIMSWGALDKHGNIVRDPNFPDLPSFKEVYEMVNGKAPSGKSWDAWKAFFTAGFPGQKMVFLPKGTSDDIIETYRNAFERVVNEPGFTEAAAKVLGAYPQSTQKSAETVMNLAVNVDPEAKSWVRGWLQEKYNVRF